MSVVPWCQTHVVPPLLSCVTFTNSAEHGALGGLNKVRCEVSTRVHGPQWAGEVAHLPLLHRLPPALRLARIPEHPSLLEAPTALRALVFSSCVCCWSLKKVSSTCAAAGSCMSPGHRLWTQLKVTLGTAP